MLIQLSDKEFNEFAKKNPLSTFFQSSYWGDLKEITGWKKHIVGIKENGVIKGASLILSKKIPILNKKIFYAPRGFLLDYNENKFLEEFTKEVLKYIKKEKGIFLKINPYVMYQERDVDGEIVPDGVNNKSVVDSLNGMGFNHNGFTIKTGEDLEPRWLSVLDLNDKTEESLLSDMRSKTRQRIQNSYKRGFELVEVTQERLPEFKSMMEHTGERRGFIDRPLSYYQKLYECFKDNNIKIMLVELNINKSLINLKEQEKELLEKIKELEPKSGGAKGKRMLSEVNNELEDTISKIKEMNNLMDEEGDKIVVAGGLFMAFGRQVISLFGASYQEYMKYNGQYFLNFEMIKYALENNYDKYNFYGIEGTFDKKSEMYGLFDFKRGFNAKVVELIGEFNYIVNKRSYFLYKILFGLYRKLKSIIKR